MLDTVLEFVGRIGTVELIPANNLSPIKVARMPVRTLFPIMKVVKESDCTRMTTRLSQLFSDMFAKSRSQGGQNG